jgi:hypothetical protein
MALRSASSTVWDMPTVVAQTWGVAFQFLETFAICLHLNRSGLAVSRSA